ncbi:MAG: orotate phosphoribosyltransferase [bacterium]|nr:orotate phosphoribosyltransferase [bacterium]
MNESLKLQLLQIAQKRDALRMDQAIFTLKSGRQSPYFFNAGMLQDAEAYEILSEAFASAIEDECRNGLSFHTLYGPASKGIPLAMIAATGLYRRNRSYRFPFVFNRKESKDYGEKRGFLVGDSILGRRILIVDDVITAGTAVEESIEHIKSAGGIPAGLAIILDRQERGKDTADSAIQEVQKKYHMPAFSILKLDDLLKHLGEMNVPPEIANAMQEYRAQYGVTYEE